MISSVTSQQSIYPNSRVQSTASTRPVTRHFEDPQFNADVNQPARGDTLEISVQGKLALQQLAKNKTGGASQDTQTTAQEQQRSDPSESITEQVAVTAKETTVKNTQKAEVTRSAAFDHAVAAYTQFMPSTPAVQSQAMINLVA